MKIRSCDWNINWGLVREAVNWTKKLFWNINGLINGTIQTGRYWHVIVLNEIISIVLNIMAVLCQNKNLFVIDVGLEFQPCMYTEYMSYYDWNVMQKSLKTLSTHYLNIIWDIYLNLRSFI